VRPDERFRVLAALVFVQVAFAVHYVLAKMLLARIEPRAWAAARLLAAAAILLAVYVLRSRRGIRPGDLVRLAGLSVFGVVLNQICFVEGLARTTPSHSSLINTTIPVATVVFAVLLGREPLRRATAAGIFLSMAGVLVLLHVDRLEVRAEWFLGDLLTQLNAASFAFFLVISKNTIRRVGSLPATAAVLCFGSVGATLYGGPAAARIDPASLPASLWAIAAYIVAFPTVIAYFLNYWALARVESSQVALFVYLQPILASALSVAWLGEAITPRLVVSSALVFAGVLFATRDLDRGGRGEPETVPAPERA
jgi:drug/metabolite transporter (DMT)-like permease